MPGPVCFCYMAPPGCDPPAGSALSSPGPPFTLLARFLSRGFSFAGQHLALLLWLSWARSSCRAVFFFGLRSEFVTFVVTVGGLFTIDGDAFVPGRLSPLLGVLHLFAPFGVETSASRSGPVPVTESFRNQGPRTRTAKNCKKPVQTGRNRFCNKYIKMRHIPAKSGTGV